MILRRSVADRFIPFVTIELKSLIHSEVNGCHLSDVNECLLFGKYAIETHKSDVDSLLCCLTDSRNWHVFQYDGFRIDKYYKFFNDDDCCQLYKYLHKVITSKLDELRQY